ncbi:hypothetical protein HaLaN_03872 [Haematococcus lacustris]|uniref:Uncharacterized protein n=1 Tax=Haematococcus lacustris TaxID=44745 RepID=A0A699YHB5_HAELA|nr:hypothetical protein HaLaN_03872 [Haematococcus lacustris]
MEKCLGGAGRVRGRVAESKLNISRLYARLRKQGTWSPCGQALWLPHLWLLPPPELLPANTVTDSALPVPDRMSSGVPAQPGAARGATPQWEQHPAIAAVDCRLGRGSVSQVAELGVRMQHSLSRHVVPSGAMAEFREICGDSLTGGAKSNRYREECDGPEQILWAPPKPLVFPLHRMHRAARELDSAQAMAQGAQVGSDAALAASARFEDVCWARDQADGWAHCAYEAAPLVPVTDWVLCLETTGRDGRMVAGTLGGQLLLLSTT